MKDVINLVIYLAELMLIAVIGLAAYMYLVIRNGRRHTGNLLENSWLDLKSLWTKAKIGLTLRKEESSQRA